ncbi:DUF2079 domain-containing protein [Candidatus Roizmanbacteria bacterium]|nr:DUF2079 domain-containing protein [Candidatus Roizmanbacteria bacterium]
MKKHNFLSSTVVFFLVVSYVVIFSFLTVRRLINLDAHYYDLGIMDQVVYNASKGRIFQMTHPDDIINISRLAIHFDPIMMVFSPLYLIKATPAILLVGQTIVIGLGGIFIFLIAKKILESRWAAVLFVFLYLNYYPLHLTNLFDYHAVTFATTSLLAVFYFFEFQPLKKKFMNRVLGILFMAIAFLSKENIALILVFLSGYFFLTKKKEKKLYASLVLANTILFILIVFKIIPSFNGDISFAVKYYDFRYPLALLRQLVSRRSIFYVGNLLLPFSFLSLLSPQYLVIAAPEFLINLLSSNDNMRQLYFHYTAVIAPFVAVSSIYGFKKLLKLPKFSEKIALLTTISLTISILCSCHFELPKLSYRTADKNTINEVNYWRDVLKNDKIKVSATGSIAPFFTEREYFFNFLFDPAYEYMGRTSDEIQKNIDKYEEADYVVIFAEDINLNNSLEADYYNHLKANKNFQQIASNNNIEVYKKLPI